MGHRGGGGRSRQGWGEQKRSGGELGRNLSDPQEPQLPPAAAAALRGQRSRPGEKLRGPAKEKERNRLGTPILPTLQVLSQPLVTSLSPIFPSPGSISSHSSGSHFFPRTCGCSRRGSGVPQGWSIRVEHLEERREDAKGIKHMDRHAHMGESGCLLGH